MSNFMDEIAYNVIYIFQLRISLKRIMVLLLNSKCNLNLFESINILVFIVNKRCAIIS